MTFVARLSHTAAKQLDRLDAGLSNRIRARIREVALSPYDPRISKALKSHPGRRARVGGWRIIYSVNTTDGVVEIESIAARGEA